MELHHPIMSKLWDLGGRTKRNKKETIYLMIPPMALGLALLSLPLASITITLSSYILLTRKPALSLVSPLSISAALSLCPIPVCYPNRESIPPSISMYVNCRSLRISSASLFVFNFHLLTSLMVALILVWNFSLAPYKSSDDLYLRALSHRYLIPYIFSLVTYCINHNQPPSTIYFSPQNISSPCLLISWQPTIPFCNGILNILNPYFPIPILLKTTYH